MLLGMRTSEYTKELQKAREELAELLRKREETEVEIARQKRKVAAWAELCDEGEVTESSNALLQLLGMDLGGLTEACRTAMRASRKEWMTINEIQELLKELGFPLDKYKAPVASITTTVNRLVEGKEVVTEKRSSGASEYKWVGLAGIGEVFAPPRKSFGQRIGESNNAFYGEQKPSAGTLVRKTLNYQGDKKK